MVRHASALNARGMQATCIHALRPRASFHLPAVSCSNSERVSSRCEGRIGNEPECGRSGVNLLAASR